MVYLLWEKVGLQLYPKPAEKDRFTQMIHLNPDLCIGMMDSNQQIIGTVFGAFDGRTASIHRFAIAPAHQKQGLGTRLLRTLEETLSRKGIKKITVQIHRSNMQAADFYKQFDYKNMDYAITLYKDLV